MAHQEFIERIGDVSPVHIHELEELGSRRIKETKRNPNVPNGINQGKQTRSLFPLYVCTFSFMLVFLTANSRVVLEITISVSSQFIKICPFSSGLHIFTFILEIKFPHAQ